MRCRGGGRGCWRRGRVTVDQRHVPAPPRGRRQAWWSARREVRVVAAPASSAPWRPGRWRRVVRRVAPWWRPRWVVEARGRSGRRVVVGVGLVGVKLLEAAARAPAIGSDSRRPRLVVVDRPWPPAVLDDGLVVAVVAVAGGGGRLRLWRGRGSKGRSAGRSGAPSLPLLLRPLLLRRCLPLPLLLWPLLVLLLLVFLLGHGPRGVSNPSGLALQFAIAIAAAAITSHCCPWRTEWPLLHSVAASHLWLWGVSRNMRVSCKSVWTWLQSVSYPSPHTSTEAHHPHHAHASLENGSSAIGRARV